MNNAYATDRTMSVNRYVATLIYQRCTLNME